MERKEIAKRIVMMRHLELERPSEHGMWWTCIAVTLDKSAKEGETFILDGFTWRVRKRWQTPWPRAVE